MKVGPPTPLRFQSLLCPRWLTDIDVNYIEQHQNKTMKWQCVLSGLTDEPKLLFIPHYFFYHAGGTELPHKMTCSLIKIWSLQSIQSCKIQSFNSHRKRRRAKPDGRLDGQKSGKTHRASTVASFMRILSPYIHFPYIMQAASLAPICCTERQSEAVSGKC